MRILESFLSRKQEAREQKLYERKDDKEAQKRIEQLDKAALTDELKNERLRLSVKLIEALARLSIELEDNMSEYDTILSDDASGRLVSLFLRHIINKSRERDDSEQKEDGIPAKPPIKTYFVATGYHRNKSKARAIEKFIEKKKAELGKVLVVTEYISSGASVMKLVEILEKLNIDFNVATVSANSLPYEDSLQKRLIYGEVGNSGLAFYSKVFSSGVEKSSDTESPHPEAIRSEEAVKHVKTAREDMKMLAGEISKIIKTDN